MANQIAETLSRANGTAHDSKNQIYKGDNNLEKMAHDAGERVGVMATNVADTAKEYTRAGREYINDNPGKSIAIATAVGMVAGSIFTLSMRRK